MIIHYIGDNGKSNGNYYRILGVYRDNGKENGNYGSSARLHLAREDRSHLDLDRLDLDKYLPVAWAMDTLAKSACVRVREQCH